MSLSGPGAGAAQESSKRQQEDLLRQRRREELRSAESESDIQRRRAVALRGGTRASLLATSPTGVTANLAQNLGG